MVSTQIAQYDLSNRLKAKHGGMIARSSVFMNCGDQCYVTGVAIKAPMCKMTLLI